MRTYKQLSADVEYFECQLPVIDETEKAVCFDSDGGHLKTKSVWLPKSQMEIIEIVDHDGRIDKRYFVRNWLYSKLK